jgi:hypothetical protein
MLSARKQGSLSLFVENQSQTRTFVGEVAEGNTGAGTCLVRFSGGRVMTCDVVPGVQLNPGDKVTCTRVPGSMRLVATPGSVAAPDVVTNVTTVSQTRSSAVDSNELADTGAAIILAEYLGPFTIEMSRIASAAYIPGDRADDFGYPGEHR